MTNTLESFQTFFSYIWIQKDYDLTWCEASRIQFMYDNCQALVKIDCNDLLCTRVTQSFNSADLKLIVVLTTLYNKVIKSDF